jgi:hypothetical protein
MYIVPSIVDEDSVASLILPALFLADRKLYNSVKSKLNGSQVLGVASVTPWEINTLGHQSQTFVPMACEDGETDLVTNTAPSRYLIPNVTVTFQTFDADGPGSGGLFEIRAIRPDSGACGEWWVEADDVLDTRNLLEALSANV